jgi:hypothetical protein
MGLEVSTVLFIISTTVSVATAMMARKKAKAAEDAAKGQEVRFSNSAEEIDIVYGQTAVGGIQVFTATSNNLPSTTTTNKYGSLSGPQTGKKNEYLMTQSVLGVGEFESVSEVWADDLPANSGEMAGYNFIQWKYNAHNSLAGNFSTKINSTSKFTGLTHSTNIHKLNRDDPQFSGVPACLHFCKGNKIYSIVRSGTSPNYTYALSSSRAYSSNPSYILLDYLTSTAYGLGWSAADDIDLESFYNSAVICNQVVQGTENGTDNDVAALDYPFESETNGVTITGTPVYNNARTQYYNFSSPLDLNFNPNATAFTSSSPPGSLARYTFNGSLSTGSNHRDNIGSILGVMPGSEFFRSPTGHWKLVAPDSLTVESNQSVGVISSSELVKDVSIVFPDSTDRINQMTIKFANINKDFADDTITTPESGSDAYNTLLSQDVNIPLIDTETIRGINNKYHAKSIAGNLISLSRKSLYSFELRPKGFLYEPGDILQLIDEGAGIGFKAGVREALYVKVVETKVKSNLNVEIKAIEFNRNDYGWHLTTPEAVENRDAVEADLGVPESVTAVADLDERLTVISWAPNANEDVTVNGYIVEATPVTDDPTTGDPISPASNAVWEVVGITTDGVYRTTHVFGDGNVRFGYRVIATTSDGRRSTPSATAYSARTSEADVSAALRVYFDLPVYFFDNATLTSANPTAGVKVFVGTTEVPLSTATTDGAMANNSFRLVSVSATNSITTSTSNDTTNDKVDVTVSNFSTDTSSVVTANVKFKSPAGFVVEGSANISIEPLLVGSNGADGAPGVDGLSTRVDLAYFDDASGNNPAYPSGTLSGSNYVKATRGTRPFQGTNVVSWTQGSTETPVSTTFSDYEVAQLVGEDGSDGLSNRLDIGYADNSNGSGNTRYPSGTYGGGNYTAASPEATSAYFGTNIVSWTQGTTEPAVSTSTGDYEWASYRGAPGANGANSSVVYAYKRDTSLPTNKPSTTRTYTFADGTFDNNDLGNGWYANAFTGTGDLYTCVAVATSTGTTDNVVATDWSTAQLFSNNPERSAVVYAYRRSSTSLGTSTKPSLNSDYTFATGAWSIASIGNSFYTSIPSGTDTIYFCTALAVSTGTSDTVLSTDWSSPMRLSGQDGVNGTNGTNGTNGGNGDRGPGNYTLGVSSLSSVNTGAEIEAKFNGSNAPLPSGAVEGDLVHFYTGTQTAPTSGQGYVRGASYQSWSAITSSTAASGLFGTVNAARIASNSLELSKMKASTGNSKASLNQYGMKVTDASGVVRVKLGDLANL